MSPEKIKDQSANMELNAYLRHHQLSVLSDLHLDRIVVLSLIIDLLDTII